MNLASKSNERLSYYELKGMTTTLLMSRLNHTCQNENFFIDYLLLNIGSVDIVVIHSLPDKYGSIVRKGGSWTMTFLKKYGYRALEKMDEDRAIRKVHWNENLWLDLWAIPLHLRAVTDGDKNFRKEWVYGELVYEGNQYGDTSDFYIIGTLGLKKKEVSRQATKT